ncbi:hypothetical protein DL764_002374 [Monosporascus ibericus]|uniref:Heterokaryon incompatibility domain-containing protein n=1 Tax=Monosporascus ibericus TaxID=155417 RepID=A0A4Q4TNZ4_9PEZI|nr:hypothetical protein DL764_002374 [Monosporascus ibericus]
MSISDDPAAEFVSTRPLALQPSSQENFSRIRQYLVDCFRREGIHADCEASSAEKVPTRLLKIHALSQGVYGVRIDCAADPVTYAAPSYCWGGEQVHKTTTENLPRYSLNVQWETLPKTIQDAVKVTAALDIEYLWVDSICIVQDDDDDKAREIADMPSIYNGATVTIVAATAKTAKDGFLHDRDPHTLIGNAFSLPFRCPDGRIGSVYLSKIGSLEFDEHIDTRAWTLQEAYLSTRLLRFGNKQCSLMCQCSPSKPRIVDGWKLGQEYDVRHIENIIFLSTLNVEDDVPAFKHFYKSTYGTDLEYDVDARETVHGDFIDMWRDLVEAYTTRSLSVPEDRCLAISGLADRIAPILKTDYVAGHWEKFLPADLLWRVRKPQPKPRAYQGPSWSWTSVNGSVLFSSAATNMSLEVQKVDAQLSSAKAPFGAVKQGRLRVCAQKNEGNTQHIA